ncbi:MAG: glycosyl hydrolase family 57 [Planctomycetota bacterium]|jgi:hypothetical protein|nr:glycosyl hydrolase family 57 [Planctomycetota bacterium]
MSGIFNRIDKVEIPSAARAGADGYLPETTLVIRADGEIPFPQLVIRDAGGAERLIVKERDINQTAPGVYAAVIPAGKLRAGSYQIQAEGCRTADLAAARPGDWLKCFLPLEVAPQPSEGGQPAVSAGPANQPRLYFGIHKHMHQPYYRAAEPGFWDGGNDEIFASRAGAYRRFINLAASQYQRLPEAGLSMSWSGSLLEQLDRASREGLAHGAYGGDWKGELRAAAHSQTAAGWRRAEFSAFGFFHPLMPLIPPRDIKAQILRHRDFIQNEFGVPASRFLFPPETAFHARMIPALLEAGVEGVIYDSIHRYRACRDYPYAGREEGMLPPNSAEQENPPVDDWLQLRNVWAGSKISPSLLRPEYLRYVDVDGREYKIIGIPAERYLGNEDARGGYGALIYQDVLGQVLDAAVRSGGYDPAHPPFFLLHSDGDNYGGGAESYYGSNTGALVEWLKAEPRFELVGIGEYLRRFPPDPARTAHVEPGAWSGADNGDPQFMKWFSGYNAPYSPDLNSWAVLTALQNAIHTMLDACPGDPGNAEAERLTLTAETSCYWYWTGQELWDGQVTAAANAALDIIRGGLDALLASGRDATGPTIFPPWITPENPGGLAWGNNCLIPAGRVGTAHSFIHDVSGVKSARLFIRPDAGRGEARELPLADQGPYPSRIGAKSAAHLYTAELPAGMGDIRYWLEAVDGKGNKSRSALERVFLA